MCSQWPVPVSPSLPWLEMSPGLNIMGAGWGGLGSRPRDKWPQVDWALLLAMPRRPRRHEVLLAQECGPVPFSPQPRALRLLDLPPTLPQTCWTHFSPEEGRNGSSVFYRERFFPSFPPCRFHLTSELVFKSGTFWVTLLSRIIGWWMNQSGCVGLELVIGGIHSLCKSNWWILVRLW